MDSLPQIDEVSLEFLVKIASITQDVTGCFSVKYYKVM